jgi:hypothetical protein
VALAMLLFSGDHDFVDGCCCVSDEAARSSAEALVKCCKHESFSTRSRMWRRHFFEGSEHLDDG